MHIYSKPYYKYYILIPLALALVSIILATNIPRAVDITGGTSLKILVPTSIGVEEKRVSNALSDLPLQSLRVSIAQNPISNEKMYVVEYSLKQENDTKTSREIKTRIAGMLGVTEDRISTQEIGPSVGKIFWESGLRAIVLAFLFMAGVVFVTFREIAPSTYVISAAILDVVYALGGMAMFGIPLSLATIAALLMIIGYSVDTDILLTNNVLKRKTGSVDDRLWKAMKTGLTMSGTTLSALLVLTISAYILHIQTLLWIGSALTFGLIGDLISTWFMNAVILKWWIERRSIS